MSATPTEPAAEAGDENLRHQADTAQAQLARLEAEYAQLLSDPDSIQEDRDGTRTLLEAARLTLERAESALRRRAEGSYGKCVRCGAAIAPERLEAIPEATTCVSCA